MIDYGSAFIFNMMPIDVRISLNGGEWRLVRRISGSEPFDPFYCIFERSFEKPYPKNLFGMDNKIIFTAESDVKMKNEVFLQMIPTVFNLLRDVQIYLYYDYIVKLYEGRGRIMRPEPCEITKNLRTSTNSTAYFFNLTGQSILFTLNNDKTNSIIIPPASESEPFTPSYIHFSRTTGHCPKRSFGDYNEIECLLAASKEDAALRKFTVQVKQKDSIDPWDLENDIQIYLFNDLLVVRKGGCAMPINPDTPTNPDEQVRL